MGVPLTPARVRYEGEGEGEAWGPEGVDPMLLRRAAVAILKHGKHMPDTRREEVLQVREEGGGGGVGFRV